MRNVLSRYHPEPQDRDYKIYCVDFDGTLYVNGQMDMPFLEKLLKLQQDGNQIVLYTSRVMKPLDEAIKICENHWLTFDDIYGGKPYADAYVDDLNITKQQIMLQS